MKMTDLSILCKCENLTNRQCIKYLFAPLYLCISFFSRKEIKALMKTFQDLYPYSVLQWTPNG